MTVALSFDADADTGLTNHYLDYGHDLTFSFAPTHAWGIDLYDLKGNDFSWAGYATCLSDGGGGCDVPTGLLVAPGLDGGPINYESGLLSLYSNTPFTSVTMYADRSPQWYGNNGPGVAAPEPSTWLMLILGAAFLLAPKIRRHVRIW